MVSVWNGTGMWCNKVIHDLVKLIRTIVMVGFELMLTADLPVLGGCAASG